MPRLSIQALFEEAIQYLPYSISPDVLINLIEYQKLLDKWNQKINLSAHRSPQDSIEKNFLDSLFVGSELKGSSILDFGSGAGFPGLVLAVLYPDKKFFLVEADQKKSSFLKFIRTQLHLMNVEVLNQYVSLETQGFPENFPQNLDFIVSRATISPKDLLMLGEHGLSREGKLGLMLSKKQKQDFSVEISGSFEMELEKRYTLPWSKIDHFFLVLRKR